MADMAAMFESTEQVTIDWRGKHITLTYRDATEERDLEIFGGATGTWTAENVRKFLVASIVEWDLTEGGKPAPISHATLKKLPGKFNVGLFRLIRGLDEEDPTSLKIVSPSG